MPNINDWLNNILTARYGEEVRGSIYNSIKLFNETLNNTSSQFNKDAAAVKESITVAQQAATTAQTAATTATTAKTAAETAKTAAETAKTGAEKAKTDARAYADITAGYVNEANAAATRAEAARDDTIEAKDVSVAAILQQQAESAQAVINTGNTVKDEITAKTTESVNAVKTQETASKAAVTAAGDEVADAITAKTTEAVAAVGTAEADALQKIGDAADDIISGGDSLYVKKTGDTITGIVKAPAPLENADDGQLATVGFVKSNSTKNAVTKEGTSVVIGDIQVPNPETESSVVPRSYADGNGYTQAVHDGFSVKFNENVYKNNVRVSGYNFRMISASTATNNQYALAGIIHSANGGMSTVLHISGAMGEHTQADIIDIYVETARNNFMRAVNVSPRQWLDKKVNLKIFMTNPTDTTSDFYIYVQKQTYQWVSAQLFLQPLTRVDILEAPENPVVDNDNLWTDTPEGELVYDWSTDTNEYTEHADAVPYQYAKAAGFPGSENDYKRDLANTPFIIERRFDNFGKAGHVLLASANATVNSGNAFGNLIVEGHIRLYESTNHFNAVINNRLANNNVSLNALGDRRYYVDNINLELWKNTDNKYELYLVSTATAGEYAMLGLSLYEHGPNKQWNINQDSMPLANDKFISGDIPGTKVWDLKTAWGSTSRTQITKEEVLSTLNGVDQDLVINGINENESHRLSFRLTGFTTQQAQIFSQINADNGPVFRFLARTESGGAWHSPILRGVGAPVADVDAVNYATLKSYVAANAGGFTPANNAGAHNSIYRGKSLGATITSAQLTAIKNGTFDDLYIGDYWTSSNINYRIAEFDYQPGSKHNIILIPDQPLMSASYFPGGKKNTDSWTKNMCANFTPPNIPASLVANTNVKSFEVMQGQNWRPLTGEFAYVEWVSKKAWFPSEQQIFGNEVYSHFHGIESALFLTAQEGYAYETDSQFALFRLNPNLIASTNGNPYWLCDTYPVKNVSNYHTYGIKVNYGTRLCEQIYDAADNLTSSVTAYLRPYYVIEPV